MDRRVSRTKRLLKDALINLMREKEFDKITIKDLTDKADVNRATFYLHYKDKYDLIEQSSNEILGNISSIIKEHSSDGIIDNRDRNKVLEILTSLYSYIKENSDFIGVVLGPNGDLSFQVKLKSLMDKMIRESSYIGIKNKHRNISIEYLTTIASSAQLGIIQKWIESGMKETPMELALIISKVIVNVTKDI
ncbi:TetR/AcrR family transcriptional regulator [[Clostridium] dakarense]|uniref:TetR/AcrR family transcriptional regulator n=1 Tax=Faecalimicrobium dakarense TaxID=1301100 RepID=UPI0004B33B48|nr:TetR/AcrR family transcriptional regulator [[Clostridium] dakarense]